MSNRKIYLVRHAKSCWDDPSVTDKERPLNKRGKHNAPAMAKLMAKKEHAADLLVSSPAKRALTTAVEFARAFKIEPDTILQVGEIYEAFPVDLLQVIRRLPNEYHTVYMFGHNPGYTYLVNYFKGGEGINNLPTTGIVRLDTYADSWKDFSPENTEVKAYYAPKISL